MKITVKLPHVTTRVADAEISAVLASEGPEISDCVAVTIASWWQSPGSVGRHLAALASGSPVEYGDLAQDVYLTHNDHRLSLRDRQGLDVLSTWALDRTRVNTRDYSSQGLSMRRSYWTDPDTGITEIVTIVTWDELQEEARAADDA